MEDTILISRHRWLEEEQIEDALETDDVGNGPLQMFSVVMSNALLFFLIFGLSATVEVRNLRHQLTNKQAIATGVGMQFIIMPFLGFTAISLLKGTEFTQAMGVALLVVTASPGGSYSNWWCSLFNAELALSVAMTSVSSILSVGLLPANMLLYSWLAYSVVIPPPEGEEEVNVLQALNFGAIFISLGVVMGAIITGLYAGYKFDNADFHLRANKFGSACGLCLILFSAFLGSGAGGSDTNFWSLPWSFYAGVAFPCVFGMALANVISRSFHLSPPETVAISIECCYQNTAIATSVAVTMFSDPTSRAEAVSVPLFYGIVEAVIICIYCVWAWKVGWTKAPADEKLCVVVTRTYEINTGEQVECEEPVDYESLNCWGRMFIPRHQMEKGKVESDKKGNESDARGRFYSADVTVATTTAVPGTPDTVLETIIQEDDKDPSDFTPDLETPSMMQRMASAICAVEEDYEKVSVEAFLVEETSEDLEEQRWPIKDVSPRTRDSSVLRRPMPADFALAIDMTGETRSTKSSKSDEEHA